MANYVFTHSMKRHERSDLCFKLYMELKVKNRIVPLLLPLKKIINQKKKAENKFKPCKERIYASTTFVYKGVTIYIIVSKQGYYDFIFNTSPIDAPYAEFIVIVDGFEMKTVIYTQHALDRYNERIHNDKYTNHRDLMKRFIVNNATKSNFITDEDTHKSVARIDEGFICGIRDDMHQYIVVNTFYDSEEDRDDGDKEIARTIFKNVSKLSIQQRAMYRHFQNQLAEGSINQKEFNEFLLKLKLDIEME
ncbi:MAG: hypothetical protein ACSHXF_10965 [Aquaticitalea sp.]